jgi:hypothetical protein
MEEDEFDAQMDAYTGEEHDWRYFTSFGCTTAANAVSTLCHKSQYYEMSLTSAASMFARATTPPAMDTIARNASVATTGVKVFYEGDWPEGWPQGRRAEFDNVYEEEESEGWLDSVEGIDYGE